MAHKPRKQNPPDAGNQAREGDTQPTHSPSVGSAGGRIFWLTLALLFLCVMAVALWLLVRTPAAVGDRESLPDLFPATEALPVDGEVPSPDAPSAKSLPSNAKVGAGEAMEADATCGEAVSVSDAETDDGDGNIVYYRRRNDRMEIALSFDDGPHPRYTPEILSILAEYGVSATFFMVGENVMYYPEAASAVIAAGHEVGNHSFSHRRLSGLSEWEIRSEITRCEEALANVGECRPHLLRPPEGSMNATLRRISGQMDYRMILWDIDTRDWAHTPPSVICEQILDKVQAGDIILMHDYIGRDSPTPEALRLVIPELLQRGYHFVTVSELIDGA
jgi:peptidoglycan/xylan/chitin deacetylase (PgdA/CDA1 family)